MEPQEPLDEAEQSPFAEIGHPRMRAWLESLATTGSKVKACDSSGVSRATPYTRQWQDWPGFKDAEALAMRIAAEELRDEAKRRAVAGQRAYKHNGKTGAPLPHPELCDCGHSRDGHPRLPAAASWDDRGPCTAMDCGCPRFVPAPYFEDARSDGLLTLLLKAGLAPEFAEQRSVEVRGLIGHVDVRRLPPEAVERIAAGEWPDAVFADLRHRGLLGPGPSEAMPHQGEAPAPGGLAPRALPAVELGGPGAERVQLEAGDRAREIEADDEL